MRPGFDGLSSVIVRHLHEDPQILQTAMELEIRQLLTSRVPSGSEIIDGTPDEWKHKLSGKGILALGCSMGKI